MSFRISPTSMVTNMTSKTKLTRKEATSMEMPLPMNINWIECSSSSLPVLFHRTVVSSTPTPRLSSLSTNTKMISINTSRLKLLPHRCTWAVTKPTSTSIPLSLFHLVQSLRNPKTVNHWKWTARNLCQLLLQNQQLCSNPFQKWMLNHLSHH